MGEQVHQTKVEEGIPLQIINEIWLLVWPGSLCAHEDDGDDDDDGDKVEMTSKYHPHAPGGGKMTWLGPPCWKAGGVGTRSPPPPRDAGSRRGQEQTCQEN